MRSKLLGGALFVMATAWACHQVILTAPLGSTMTLFANPTFICANGCKSTISAIVIEGNTGTPVADGTVVQFFTTLGKIDEQGKTNDGVARVNLVSDGRSGTAQITAFSGTATATLGGGGGNVPSPAPSPGQGGGGSGVLIGNTSAARVLVSATPQRIRPNDARVSTITATVFDTNGNFLSGVPVSFTTSATPNEEEIDTGLQFTDNNGQVSVVMRTRADREGAPKDVTVTAVAANGEGGVTGSTTVTVN